MNHLEELVSQWLNYNGYFVRAGIRVGKRPKGGWDGELDVVAFHPTRSHFLHVECSTDGDSWNEREQRFRRKFETGRNYANSLFDGLVLPQQLDQAVVHAFLAKPDEHRDLGGGRLVTVQELTSEIILDTPPNAWSKAVPESYPLLRTLQWVRMAGATVTEPQVRLIPRRHAITE